MPRRPARPVLEGRHVGALDVRTEVPTPHGSTTVGELEAGDTVFGADGKPVTVHQVSVPIHQRECFEIEFSTGERIVADDEQRLLIERRHLQRSLAGSMRRPTAEVAGAIASLGPAAYAVRVAPPVQLPAKRLPLDPYLFGVWLGAGVPGQAAIAGADAELVRRLTESGARVFTSELPGQHWVSAGGIIRRGADLRTRLAELGVLEAKHLPTAYLRASEDQRRQLLAGLLDAAAIVSDGGEVVLRSASAGVAIGAFELIASLGLRPTFRPAGRVVEIGFVTGTRVFGRADRQDRLQARQRLHAGLRQRRLVRSVDQVASRPVRQVVVASDEGLLLVGRSFIPMPAATVEPAERISSPA